MTLDRSRYSFFFPFFFLSFFAKQDIRTWWHYTGIQDFPFQNSKFLASIITPPSVLYVFALA